MMAITIAKQYFRGQHNQSGKIEKNTPQLISKYAYGDQVG